MKYLFRSTNDRTATHTRLSDGVTGRFITLPDTATTTGDPAMLLTSQDGFAPTTPPTPVVVPQEIKNWQAKAAIELAGLTAAVEAAMQSLDEPARTVALSAWENGADLDRRGATVLALAAALGLTDAQVDALFVTGGSLTV